MNDYTDAEQATTRLPNCDMAGFSVYRYPHGVQKVGCFMINFHKELREKLAKDGIEPRKWRINFSGTPKTGLFLHFRPDGSYQLQAGGRTSHLWRTQASLSVLGYTPPVTARAQITAGTKLPAVYDSGAKSIFMPPFADEIDGVILNQNGVHSPKRHRRHRRNSLKATKEQGGGVIITRKATAGKPIGVKTPPTTKATDDLGRAKMILHHLQAINAAVEGGWTTLTVSPKGFLSAKVTCDITVGG